MTVTTTAPSSLLWPLLKPSVSTDSRSDNVIFWGGITSFVCISGEAVLSACEKACELFDMRHHSGVHPCLGAVDLVPIYPLGEDVGTDDCARESRGEIPLRSEVLFVGSRFMSDFAVFLTLPGFLSGGRGPDPASAGNQRLPLRVGGRPASAGAGAEEEGDGLVQEDARLERREALRRARAAPTLRPHRSVPQTLAGRPESKAAR